MTKANVFPYQIEWLGGRNTIQKSTFSARNAYICLEDMKEADISEPIVLEKNNGKLALMSDSCMKKDFDLTCVKQIHFFPSDPDYTVLEICDDHGPSRLEVFRAPSNEVMVEVRRFIFQDDFVYNSNRSDIPADIHTSESEVAYARCDTVNDESENIINDSNGLISPGFHSEEGYEEVAQQLVDDTMQDFDIMRSEQDRKSLEEAEEEEEHSRKIIDADDDDYARNVSSPLLAFDKDDFEQSKHNETEITIERLDQTIDMTHVNDSHQNANFMDVELGKPRMVERKDRMIGKPQLIAEIRAEEGICSKHMKDDGIVYLITHDKNRLQKIRPIISKDKHSKKQETRIGSMYKEMHIVYTNPRVLYAHNMLNSRHQQPHEKKRQPHSCQRYVVVEEVHPA